MIKEALAYLVGLKENQTYCINGDTYSDNALTRIPPHIDRPKKIRDQRPGQPVKLIKTEIPSVKNPSSSRHRPPQRSVFTPTGRKWPATAFISPRATPRIFARDGAI